MKTKIAMIIGALLCALPASAAPQMPKEFHGKWCEIDRRGFDYERCEEFGTGDREWIKITATGFTGSAGSEEYGCDPLRIIKLPPDPWIPTLSYHFKFKCGGEGGTGIQEEDWLMSKELLSTKGVLVLTVLRHPRHGKQK